MIMSVSFQCQSGQLPFVGISLKLVLAEPLMAAYFIEHIIFEQTGFCKLNRLFAKSAVLMSNI